MLITTEIRIKISSPTIRYYRDMGYDVKFGEYLKIPISDLNKKSNEIVSIKCDFCDSQKETPYIAYNRYVDKSPDGMYRCNKCNSSLRKSTCQLKYGVSHYSKTKEFSSKYKETLYSRYGGHYNKLESFKEKIKNTNLIRYDVDYPMQNDTIRESYQKTIFDKFGSNCVLQNDEVLLKSLDTMNTRYGHTYSMQINSISDKIIFGGKKSKMQKIINKNKDIIKIDYDQDLYYVNCGICNNTYEISPHMFTMRKKYNTIICTLCNVVDSHISGRESSFLDIIKENYNDEIVLNSRRLIPPYEIDIFLPKLNLGFEFNGLYWHSDIYKDKLYHMNKSDLCLESGIQLIHIWEDDWIYKQDIVKSMVLNKIGKSPNKIFARKCKILEVTDNKLVREFLDLSHIQGFVGSKIKLGLFYNGELVSLMTFGNLRKSLGQKSEDESYELLRFCNKLNTNVIGGASKLFKYFIENYRYTEIVTYADRSHSSGGIYDKLGFRFVSKLDPNYYYIMDGIRKHRFGFRKDVLIKDGFDPSRTEIDIMAQRGINRIHNAGNLKYIFTNTSKV